jgi:tRNA pseudouridine32 synthase/23S rRNA pseudouridine746 synthase
MLSKQEHLRVLYSDEALVVVDKPSGVLTVPDINNNPSLLDLVWEEYGPDEGGVNHVGDDVFHQPSCMIVNRLDMDTSGIVVFGRNAEATRSLNQAFRERRVLKEYEAVLCGHLPYSSGLIDLPLQKCHTNPPFMRVSTPSSELASNQLIEDLIEAGYKRMGRKQPKHSQTEFEVLERTYYESDPQLPITRVRLKPLTGRTHQLRVHLAAIGFPILGDASYGISGSAATVGGLHGVDIQEPAGFGRASIGLQEALAQRHPPNTKSMCLHAALLRLIHPVVGELVEWKATVPF